MSNFIEYIVESTIQPVKTNVLWIKNGMPYYYSKGWKPLYKANPESPGGGESDIVCNCPLTVGNKENTAIFKNANCLCNGEYGVALGYTLTTNNNSETAFGKYNNSVISNDPSKATLFSIGNGTSSAFKNAFEVKYDGSIYISGINSSLQNYLENIQPGGDIDLSEITEELETLDTKITQVDNKYADEIEDIRSAIELIVPGEIEGIEGLLEKVEVLEDGVIENKSSINQLSDMISTKVEQTTFDSFKGEVTTQFTSVNQTIDAINVKVQDNTGKITSIKASVDGLIVRTQNVEADIESLKKQSDGSIETHFGTEIPTLDNEPAVNWTTEEEKNNHTGDLYYNNETGAAYRFSYDPPTSTYMWVELSDSALSEVLAELAKLQSAVDGKVTIFYTEPTNYKYGDLWFVHTNYNSYKKGTLVTATNIGIDDIIETFDETHWVEKTNYISPDDLEETLNDLNDTINDLLKDGLDEAEIKQIQKLFDSFKLSHLQLESDYNILYISSVATDENKNILKTSFDALNDAFENLEDAINNLSTDTIDTYRECYNLYLEALNAYDEIKKEFLEAVQAELLKANQYIEDIVADNIVTPIEKKQLIEIWRQLSEEFNANKGIATNYKIIDSEGNRRTDIYSDVSYYNIYISYRNAYNNVARLISPSTGVFGLDDLTISTTLPEDYSITELNNNFNIYYAALAKFSELISKLTIDITDAHDDAIKIANSWQDHLNPDDAISVIGKGVILSTVIGVQSGGVVEAAINASDNLPQAENSVHGKIVFAGGIKGSDDWNTATTVIYEDGYVKFNEGEVSESFKLGDAVLTTYTGTAATELNVAYVTINGNKVPLFTVEVDSNGNVVAINTLYNFHSSQNIVADGTVASGERGEGTDESLLARIIELEERIASLEEQI